MGQFWADAGGNVFLVLLGMAAAIEVAITIVSVVSLGADFLATDLAIIIITTAITAVVAIATSFLVGLGSTWAAAAIHSMEGLLNSSSTSPPGGGFLLGPRGALMGSATSTCSWQTAWDAFSTVFGGLADVFSAFTLGPGLLAGALYGAKKFSTNDIRHYGTCR